MLRNVSVLTIAASTAAQADFIKVVTDGNFEVLEVNPDQISIIFDAVVIDQVGPFGFTSINGEATHVHTTDLIFGSGQLVGDTDEDILVYMFSGEVMPGEEVFTFAGAWEANGGFGDFKGFSGFGELSGFWRYENGVPAQFGATFQGKVVPAPAAAVLLGLAGLTRRRRQAIQPESPAQSAISLAIRRS